MIFEKLIKKRITHIEKLKEKGRKIIGYFCCRFPVEIAFALDLIPIRVFPISGLYEQTGSEYIWERMCPFSRLTVGEFITKGTFLNKFVDIISGAVICQVVHRILDILQVYLKKPTLILTYPLKRPLEQNHTKLFHLEIKWLKEELEKISGKKLDNLKLRNSIETYNKLRTQLIMLHSDYVEDKINIKYEDFLKIIQLSQFLAPFETLKLIDKIKEKKYKKTKKISRDKKIIISGSMIIPGYDTIIKIIEECGGKIVADDTCYGMRSLYELTVKDYNIENISEAYLNAPPCSATQCINYEKDEHINFLKEFINKYNPDGIIYHTLRFCDPYSFKTNEIRDLFKNIPFLPLHTDVSISESQRVKTRIEAFLESLTFKGEIYGRSVL